MLIYKRIIEDKIVQNIGSGKILLIFGPRQVGKTTLSKELLKRYGDTSAYYNCEELAVRNYLAVGEPHKLKSLVGNAKWVVLDEAQTVENIGSILKVFVDSYPEIQVIATGSSSFDLANKINEPLTGRAFSYTLLPLSLEEIRASQDISRDDLHVLMRYGSYPSVVAARNENVRAQTLENIATSYLYKDIFMFERIKSPMHFEQLLKMLAYQIGSTVSLFELAEGLNVSRQTVEKYMRLLEQSYVIRRVHSFSRNLRNEMKKSFKVFFVDTGIRNAVINDTRALDSRNDSGPLFEQLYFSELLKESSLETFGPDIRFWRTHKGLEIDFVVERAGDLRAYECKWGNGNVSFKTFMKYYPTAHAEVVRPDSLLGERN